MDIKVVTEFVALISRLSMSFFCIDLRAVCLSSVLLSMISVNFLQAQGASCLEYEPTIPTKFMVGTEQGEFDGWVSVFEKDHYYM